MKISKDFREAFFPKSVCGSFPGRLYSSPGRTEVGGNHTDHNNGRVLAGAIHLDAVGLARKNNDHVIRVKSEGFPEACVDLMRWEAGNGSADRLILGLCDGFRLHGFPVGGFDAVTVSRVPPGSGLSSSAAFENLICLILADLYGKSVPAPETMAKIGRHAENAFWQKPSGLMDQMAGALGGLHLIDFQDPERPAVTPVPHSFGDHVLFITGPIGTHAGLTEDYAAIPREMKLVAGFFGKDALREVPPGDFYQAYQALREGLPQRAVLRAAHYFAENDRVLREAEALTRGDIPAFLELVNASGRSSYMYLQNVVSGTRQDLGAALAYSESLLRGRGAQRVHGGGFAGTIQAFVPEDLAETYQTSMEKVFGGCAAVRIREEGVTVSRL
ncbi:MAG: galactokinase [Oscillospiraceae bacterium]|jgi:galactokinase|nr:galactokinase [Oscillospiraceae bacterium]